MLQEVTKQNKEIFENLFQHYEAEWAFLTQKIPDDAGLYHPHYKLAKPYKAWLIFRQDKVAGFAVLHCEEPFEVIDFYIIPAYRRNAIGMESVLALFKLFKGEWHIRQPIASERAVSFWRKVVKLYTKGDFTEAVLYDSRWGKANRQLFKN